MQLRWYQKECVDAIFRYLHEREGNPIAALPTGTGKSVIIGSVVKNVIDWFPTRRCMMLTHRQELIKQNAEKLQQIYPNCHMAFHAASLKRRDLLGSIIYASVQSAAATIKKGKSFGFIDLVLIDECHTVSDSASSNYQIVLSKLKEINPNLRVVGFSATPYRSKMGMLYESAENKIFDGVCYDLCEPEMFNALIAQGYLSMLIPRPTETFIDASNVKVSAGDYNQRELEELLSNDKLINDCLNEALRWGVDRKSWLVFTAGIANAERVAELLNFKGISARVVHSKLKAEENELTINAFKNGEIRALVNADKLTTGFDCPQIDLILMMRPTKSASLWVQMLGRGTRPYPDKDNCMVLDFPQNTASLGCINDPVIPKSPSKRKNNALPQLPPVKTCPKCQVFNHAKAKFCVSCGYEFTVKDNLVATASTLALVKVTSMEEVVEVYNVDKVFYSLHEKRNKYGVLMTPPSMKVSYACGVETINEWVCFEQNGLPLQKAKQFWEERSAMPFPVTTHEALGLCNYLKIPTKVKVKTTGKYKEVIGVEF